MFDNLNLLLIFIRAIAAPKTKRTDPAEAGSVNLNPIYNIIFSITSAATKAEAQKGAHRYGLFQCFIFLNSKTFPATATAACVWIAEIKTFTI